jgi:hypothetical protein
MPCGSVRSSRTVPSPTAWGRRNGPLAASHSGLVPMHQWAENQKAPGGSQELFVVVTGQIYTQDCTPGISPKLYPEVVNATPCYFTTSGVEDRGLEPLTSCMPCKRSPS